MATIKKAMKAQKGKTVSPTYKNLPMGVKNENYQRTGVSKDVKPSSGDSARYRGGFEQGLKGKKGMPNEGNIEKMGRWEGQNAPKAPKKSKMGGKVKKAQNGTKESKNPFVKGYQKKLERVKSEGNPSNPPLKNTYSTPSKSGPKLKYSVSTDTTGLAAGKKEFPSKTTNVRTGKTSEGIIGRKAVEYRMKNPNKVGFKTGGKMTKKCKYGCK